jgi:hypothetical protein
VEVEAVTVTAVEEEAAPVGGLGRRDFFMLGVGFALGAGSMLLAGILGWIIYRLLG